VPVVVLSSSSQREDIANRYMGGANAYVRKPVDFKEFIELVRCPGKFWTVFHETI
jgi:DNA-binding NarL/FixJ family response regulator